MRYGRTVDDLVVRNGLFVRLLRAVGLVKVKPTGEVDHSAGADFVTDVGYVAPYDARASLSALAAFPWPFACVQAISTDLSKVPIKVFKGSGAQAEVLDDHPMLELLDEPSSRVGSTLFRRQLYTDLVLTGNAFILIAGSGGMPQALIRLHPARVAITPLQDGQPNQYRYEGAGHQAQQYEYEQVLHIRAPSWSDDPTSLWGTGCVQPLHHDLTTEKATADLTARTAATGQPTGILSPKEEGDRWSKEQIKTLREAYERQMQSGGSGVLILGGQAQFDKMSFTPREMEFSAVRDFVRASTLAAFDVPPARVGLPNTNYATALAQSKRYWEGLQGRAALIDAELTRLARMFGDEDITVRHDFSAVESLQESRTERLNRVGSWSMLGISVADAAAYEGFDDLPFKPYEDEAPAASPEEEPGEAPEEAPEGEEGTEEPLAATALNGAQVASLLTILGQVAAGAITFDAALALIGVAFPMVPLEEAERILVGAQALPDEDDEAVDLELRSLVEGLSCMTRASDSWLSSDLEQRNLIWKNYIADVHSPIERAMQMAARRYLRGFAARVAKRLPKVVAQRAVGGENIVLKANGDWMDELLAAYEEGQLLDKEMRATVTAAYERSIEASVAAMPSDLAGDFIWDPKRTNKLVDEHLGELIKNIDKGTEESVRALVVDGLAEGATIAELQAQMMALHSFSATRALRVARTETTKSVNAGAVTAWQTQADAAGVRVEFTWMAAFDARDSHLELDGTTRAEDGYWQYGAAQAQAPGGFEGPGSAGLNINCRCTFTPRIIR